MQIDLKIPGALTVKSVAQLLASVDDSANRQLRVDVNGFAYISSDVGSENLQGVLFRLETWCEGNDYVGSAAAQDEVWVSRIYNALKSNWPQPSSSYVDYY